MKSIKRKYILDENNQKIAVQIDIGTFNKIEETLENYSLVNQILQNSDDPVLNVNEAKKYYKTLETID